MKTIHKYEVPMEDAFKLRLPKEAMILSFQCQNGRPCIWTLVETGHIDKNRKFRLYGTGHPITDIPRDIDLHYIGTTQQSQNPPLVWHLFEEVGDDQNAFIASYDARGKLISKRRKNDE